MAIAEAVPARARKVIKTIYGFAGQYMVLIFLWLQLWFMYCFELENRKDGEQKRNWSYYSIMHIHELSTMWTFEERLIQQARLASLHSNFREDCPSERKILDVQERRWKMCPNNVAFRTESNPSGAYGLTVAWGRLSPWIR